jgi:hypothetical protein
MKWKIIAITTFVLLFISNGFWFYHTLDNGVTKTYHDEVTYEFAQTIQDLTKVCNRFINGIQEDTIKSILGKEFKSDKLFQKDSAIHISRISIGISNNKAVGIRNDDLVENWVKAKK